MINAIKNDPNLAKFVKQKSECCYDGNSEYPYIDEAIDDDSVVALTPDDYYNDYYRSHHLGDTPPSVDHLVTLACHEKGFAHFLIEDKNVKRSRLFDCQNIYHKFKTTVKDFMEQRFRQIFCDNAYPIHSIELYLVTKNRKPREKDNRTGNITRLEQLEMELSIKPLEFRGIVASIKFSDPEVLVKLKDEPNAQL